VGKPDFFKHFGILYVVTTYQGQRRDGAVTLTLLAASTLTVMAGATIAPGLPGMREHFAGVPGAEFYTKLILTIPALSIALCASFIGWFVDRAGRKSILLSAIALYAAAGTSGLYLDSIPALLAGRAILGVAVAGTMTASITLVGDYFHGADRNRVIGFQAAAMNFSGTIYLTLGGFLAESHWRAPFLVYAASLLLVPFVVGIIREPSAGEKTSTRASYRRHHGGVFGLVALLYAAVLLVQIAFYMVPVQLPFFLESIGVTSPTQTGAAIALMTVCSGSIAASYKWLRARFDNTVILGASLLLMGAGYVALSTARGFMDTAISVMVFGLGLGAQFTNFFGWLMAETPPKLRGRVVGGMTTFAFLGQFLSPVAVRPLIERFGLDGAFFYVGLGLLAGALAALAASSLKRSSRAT
jgi:MFS family permease